MDIQIRSATQEDYEQVLKLYGFFTERDYSRHDADSFSKVLQDPNSYLFVADHDGVAIGVALVTIRNVVRYARPVAELDELFVLEEYRKQGIGKKLMRAVEQKATELHCQRIYLESHADRKPAHAFYEALGYTNYESCFKK